MDVAQQFITQTPLWVWIILVWLVSRGIRARRPGATTLPTMAIFPLLFTGWGILDLYTIYGIKADTVGTWLVGIAAGTVIGWFITSRVNIVADRAAPPCQLLVAAAAAGDLCGQVCLWRHWSALPRPAG